jgi:hypothetical protein
MTRTLVAQPQPLVLKSNLQTRPPSWIESILGMEREQPPLFPAFGAHGFCEASAAGGGGGGDDDDGDGDDGDGGGGDDGDDGCCGGGSGVGDDRSRIISTIKFENAITSIKRGLHLLQLLSCARILPSPSPST